MPRFSTTIALLLTGLTTTPVAAQTVDEVNSIIRSLAPIADQRQPAAPSVDLTAPAPTTIKPPRQRETLVEVVIEEHVIFVDPTYSMDFEVYFAFDSAALTSRARADLRALGRALESPELRPHRYVIAGHTDAAGDAGYNRKLSARRAIAARQYLIRNFAIDPDRLVAVGFGEERLKNPGSPRAGINRRVEVAMIAPR